MSEKQQQAFGTLTGLGVSIVFGLAAGFVFGHGTLLLAAVPLGILFGGAVTMAYGGISVFSNDPDTEFASGLFRGGAAMALMGAVGLFALPAINSAWGLSGMHLLPH